MMKSVEYPTASVGSIANEVIYMQSMSAEEYEKERDRIKKILDSMDFKRNQKYYLDHDEGVYKPRTTLWYMPTTVVSNINGYELKTSEFAFILDKTKTLIARIARCYFENAQDHDERVNLIRDIKEIRDRVAIAKEGIITMTMSTYNYHLMYWPRSEDIEKYQELHNVHGLYEQFYRTFAHTIDSLEKRKAKLEEEKLERLKQVWEDELKESLVARSTEIQQEETVDKSVIEVVRYAPEPEKEEIIDVKSIPDPLTGFSESDVEKITLEVEEKKKTLEQALDQKYESNGFEKMGDLFYDYTKKMGAADPRLLTIRFFSPDEYILSIRPPRQDSKRSRSISMERIDNPGRNEKNKRIGEFKTNPEPCLYIRVHRSKLDGSVERIEKKVLVEQTSDLRKMVSGKLMISERELRVARNEVNQLRELKGVEGVVDLYKAVWIPDLDGTYFKMMIYTERYIEGDLSQVLERHKNGEIKEIALDVLTKKTVTEQLLQAMANIHKRNLVHMDVKLKNIILTVKNEEVDGAVKKVVKVAFCDFGFAQTPPVGTVAGSPLYWAPEVINASNFKKRSIERINTWSDVWSLYNVIYELWMERMPSWMILTQTMNEGHQVKNSYKFLQETIKVTLEDWNAKKSKTPFEKFLLSGYVYEPEKRVKSENMLEVWREFADDIVEQFQETG